MANLSSKAASPLSLGLESCESIENVIIGLMCPEIPTLVLFGGYGLEADLRPVWLSIFASLPGDPPSILGLYALPGDQKPGVAQRHIQQFEEYFASLDVDLACQLINPADALPLPDASHSLLLLGGDFDLSSDLLTAGNPFSSLIALAESTAAAGEIAIHPGDQGIDLREASGLLPGLIVLPFFDWLSGSLIARIEAQQPGSITLLGIDRLAALVYQNGVWQVIGSGKVSIKLPGGEFVSIGADHPLPDDLLPPSIVIT
jgi:hypothetical protein